jgi:hypothetical protein
MSAPAARGARRAGPRPTPGPARLSAARLGRLALALVVLAGFAASSSAEPADQGPDPVATLLTRLEQVLRDGSPERYLGLLAPSADPAAAETFAQMVIAPGCTRAVLRERDRVPLLGTLPGDGYTLLVEAFVEMGARARVATWRLDVRRRVTSPTADWVIASQQAISTLQGLYRLGLNPRRQIAVKDLVISSEDLRLTLPDATLFVAEADAGPTAVVVVGRGEMAFSPAPPAERSQLRVVTGGETLQTPFDGAFVRLHPSVFESQIRAREMVERPVDPREFKRAEDIFRQDVGKSFGLELGDLSAETWSLLPGSGDFLAEIRTRRYDALTYALSSTEVEDISLFDRKTRRNLSVYSSRAHLARYSRFYNEDDRADYIVRSYDLEVKYDLPQQRLEGLARLAIEVTAPSTSTLTLKLADSLEVQAVVARELGRLLCVRVRDQNSLVVNLPSTLVKGFRLNLEVLYSGRLEPQAIDRESIEPQDPQEQQGEESEIPFEESYLFSNRSFWYPQANVLNYATAEIRVNLGEPWAAVASGQLVSATLAPGPVERGVRRREFTFSVRQPVRYLALLVGRMTEVKREKLALHDADEVELRVVANARQRGRAREFAKTATTILKFYTSLMNDFPYSGLTVSTVERRLPGGHSPAYMAVLAIQGPASSLRWADDPGALPFADFFIAHELAHQWWGQAVGWKNYHEQWISEGFAQYFAALYAERSRGRPTFDAIIRRMQGWAVDESDQGPVFLGYRIGHVKGDSRLFRAVVYNKGAMVLHMLRGLVGDQAFFGGLRRFYGTWRFRKAGTDDLRRAMEQESGVDLGRFFERWVLGDGLPQVAFSWKAEGLDGANEAVVRLEQAGDIYDLPVTVTIEYEDNTTSNTTVKLTGKVVETRIPLTGKLRRVDVNRDRAAVGVFKAVAGG